MSRTIEVPLPEHAAWSAEELQDLATAFEAVLALRGEEGRWRVIRRGLEERGWSVTCGLSWHVEARRGRELEAACGHTRDDAFAQLDHVLHVETAEGCP